MKNLLLTLLLGLLAVSTQAQDVEIDTDKSKVTFKIKGGGAFTVPGTITGMEGDVSLDMENIADASFDVRVDVASIDTGTRKRDDHLRTADFFEVETYPTIRFESTEIDVKNGNYTAIGNLTIKDVTKEVEIPFTLEPKEDGQVLFTGNITVERKTYNVGSKVGTLKVGKKAKVTIEAYFNMN